MNYWIFQSVPERYDLREKISIEKEKRKSVTWYATRYRKLMELDDIVFFWMAGPNAIKGIYGWGKLKSTPYSIPEWDSYGVDVEYEERLEPHVSVEKILATGMQDDLPRGLLQRAALWRVRFEISIEESEITKAERDLAEAESIAERGSMHIWQIEAALERCRLSLTLASMNSVSGSNQGRPDGAATEAQRTTQREWLEQARQKLDEARKLIRRTEKPYEPHVPDWQPPDYIGVFKKGDDVGYHRRNAEIKRLQQLIDQMSFRLDCLPSTGTYGKGRLR